MTQSVPLQKIEEDNANASDSLPHRSEAMQFINFINDLLNKTFQEERGYMNELQWREYATLKPIHLSKLPVISILAISEVLILQRVQNQ